MNKVTKPRFDTIVFRRPNISPQINLTEIQCWVGGVNILPSNYNDLISYFANWDKDKTFETGDTGSRFGTAPASFFYNNLIEVSVAAHSNRFTNAVIITNIPLTAIEDIQALVLYNKQDSDDTTFIRIVNIFFELYNSTEHPDYKRPLATTTPITTAQQANLVFRYNFPSISTYTGSFATANSTTEIVSDTFAETEEAIFTVFAFDVTGDIVVEGDLTAENFFVL